MLQPSPGGQRMIRIDANERSVEIVLQYLSLLRFHPSRPSSRLVQLAAVAGTPPEGRQVGSGPPVVGVGHGLYDALALPDALPLPTEDDDLFALLDRIARREPPIDLATRNGRAELTRLVLDQAVQSGLVAPGATTDRRRARWEGAIERLRTMPPPTCRVPGGGGPKHPPPGGGGGAASDAGIRAVLCGLSEGGSVLP